MEKLRNYFKSFDLPHWRNLAFLSLFLSLGLFVAFYTPKESVFSCLKVKPLTTESKTKGTERVDDLATVLEKASKGNNKTVIIAVVNKAYVEGVDHGDDPTLNMFDLFLESFWLGEETRPLIDHLVIVAVDMATFERCLFRGVVNCYFLATNQVDDKDLVGEKVFMSQGFINMMWRRTFFLLTVLRMGYDFVFTDTDVMWLRDPFPMLKQHRTDDIKISTDRFNGDTNSDLNKINTGFYQVRSNNKTISLFERWSSMHNKSQGMKEQDVLQKMIGNGVMRELNLSVTFLETRYFSGFCQLSDDPRKVVTVHANCCRYIGAKVKDLASVLSDWKRFKRSATNQTAVSSFAWSPHANCRDSWRH